MHKIKTIGLALCAIVAVIIGLQNTEAVDTRLLLVTFTMPRALLLIITLLVGAAAGLVLGTRFNRPEG